MKKNIITAVAHCQEDLKEKDNKEDHKENHCQEVDVL